MFFTTVFFLLNCFDALSNENAILLVKTLLIMRTAIIRKWQMIVYRVVISQPATTR